MCPFCSHKDQPIRQNELAQVFLSDPHKVPGHVLVMPKRHIEQPWELTPEELLACFELIFLIEQRFIGKLGDGFDVRQSYWPFRGGGQDRTQEQVQVHDRGEAQDQSQQQSQEQEQEQEQEQGRPSRPQDELKLRHVLFHVVPRSEGDYLFKIAEGKDPEDLYAGLDEVEGDAVARLLRN